MFRFSAQTKYSAMTHAACGWCEWNLCCETLDLVWIVWCLCIVTIRLLFA